MKANMGTADRAIRFVVGIAVLSLLFVLEGNARWWGLIGLVPIGTALVGWCPAYAPFGFSTCAKKA